jgi:Lon-like protease
VAGRRGSAFVATIVALIVFTALALVPTPFFLISPGTAVDLSQSITAEGHAPPHRHFYLTDVAVTHATALLLAAGLWPGTRIVQRSALFPAGVTLRDYNRISDFAMDDSQHVAAYVAERAAGLRVAPPTRVVVVEDLVDGSRAAGVLRIGDRLVRVGLRPVYAASDVMRAITPLAPGTAAHLEIERDGRIASVVVPTIRTDNGTRLGIYLRERGATTLPVPVHFDVDGVGGASGGLMFALTIYAELTGDRRGPNAIAGTGTLDADGKVGPIEGTSQKLIAAKRAGATLFFVPRKNYADISGDRDIAIVPVDSFSQALGALH